MKGFFSKQETQLAGGEVKGFSCANCGLYKKANTPRMKPYGKFKKGIMVIGEMPVEADDKKGKPFHSQGGRFLQKKLKQLGVDLFEDCLCLNAVNCRPLNKNGETRTPSDHEIACCRAKVIRVIREYKPKVILLLGGIPTTSLIAYRWKGGASGINLWRGWAIPERKYDAWVCPTFHPVFVEKQDSPSEIDLIWEQDLKQAISCLNKPFPYPANEEECVVITEDIGGVIEEMQESSLFAFDLETTGLKPYNKDIHEIATISFCNDLNKAYACPFPTERKKLRKLQGLLENPQIGKIATNMKYEDTWLNILHGIKVFPWKFDTMLAAHILDNRPGITGLKFQYYVRFGLLGYDNEVEPYLKAQNYARNRVMELMANKEGRRKLMLYNGIDSLASFRLAYSQMKELNKELLK
jgi:uracil-DNA glycosylase family 4